MNALLMIGTLGWQEMLIILAILALLFGASRIADLGGALGRGMREFRREASGAKDEQPQAQRVAAAVVVTDAPVQAEEQPMAVTAASEERSDSN